MKLQKIKEFIYAYWNWIVVVMIWFAGVFLHLYRLTRIPAGMHVDEAGMAYDAWCLMTYGTERFLNKWPVYLINYGSGQSVLYAYLCMIFMKAGGVNLWMIRLPAFLFGCAVMVFGTLIGAKCFMRCKEQNAGGSAGDSKAKELADQSGLLDRCAVLLLALLLAVCPYFIMASRMGFDCNLMLGASTVMLYVFLQALSHGKKRYYVLTGLMLGLTLYTYSLSWVVVPVFLLFSISYLLWCKRITLKQIVCMGIPTFVLAFPLLIFVVVNRFEPESVRFLWMTVPRIPYFRTDHFSLSNIAENILLLKTLLTTDQYTFNAVEPYGTLYVVSIPLVLCGISIGVCDLVRSIRKKSFSGGCLVFCWFLAQLLCGMVIRDPDIYRTNGIYFSLAYLAVRTVLAMAGRLGSWERLRKWRNRAAYTFVAIAVLCYLGFGISFGRYYFTKYSQDYPIHWYINDHISEIMESFRDADPEQDIYFDNYNCTLYAYDCLIRRVSPYDYNKENDMYTVEETLGHRHYYLPDPEEIRDDAWYVVMEQSGYDWNLEARDFQCDEYGYYKVYYKPN